MKPISNVVTLTRLRAVRLAVLLTAWLMTVPAFAADSSALTEYQVKSLCVLNFAKYVEWPTEAFADTNTPITVGCLATGKVLEALKEAAEGKTVSGRKIQIVEAGSPEKWAGCNIIFVNSSERKHLPEILDRLKGQPVLIVGESDQFLQQGGAVNFLRKDGKIRFEINVDAAKAAHLQVSSKLLSLADNVQGKP